jgi:nitrile hydratase
MSNQPPLKEEIQDPKSRVRALQSLLVEKGLITHEAIDAAISVYEHDIGPQHGAKIVARAWSDPEYKKRLWNDSISAIGEFNFEMGSQNVEVVENTDSVHNIVVCTLCSCYPWSILGLPPTWYKSPEYRARTVIEPRAVLKEFGLDLPQEVEIKVHDSSADIRYMVLPQKPTGTESLTEEELAQLVTRDSMIGVSKINVTS